MMLCPICSPEHVVSAAWHWRRNDRRPGAAAEQKPRVPGGRLRVLLGRRVRERPRARRRSNPLQHLRGRLRARPRRRRRRAEDRHGPPRPRSRAPRRSPAARSPRRRRRRARAVAPRTRRSAATGSQAQRWSLPPEELRAKRLRAGCPRPARRRGRAPARASRAPRGRACVPRPGRAARPVPLRHLGALIHQKSHLKTNYFFNFILSGKFIRIYDHCNFNYNLYY